jgi:hypothetical protein
MITTHAVVLKRFTRDSLRIPSTVVVVIITIARGHSQVYQEGQANQDQGRPCAEMQKETK